MSDFVILLGILLLYMCATIAVGCYIWYEHNALLRKVQALEHQQEEHDGLIQQIITYQVNDGVRILELEKNAGYSETQSDDVSVGRG